MLCDRRSRAIECVLRWNIFCGRMCCLLHVCVTSHACVSSCAIECILQQNGSSSPWNCAVSRTSMDTHINIECVLGPCHTEILTNSSLTPIMSKSRHTSERVHVLSHRHTHELIADSKWASHVTHPNEPCPITHKYPRTHCKYPRTHCWA